MDKKDLTEQEIREALLSLCDALAAAEVRTRLLQAVLNGGGQMVADQPLNPQSRRASPFLGV